MDALFWTSQNPNVILTPFLELFFPQFDLFVGSLLEIFLTNSKKLPLLSQKPVAMRTCYADDSVTRKLWFLCEIISRLIIHQIFLLARDWSKHVTWPNIPQLKLWNIREYSPIFKTARVAKKIWRIIKTIVTIWGENMFGYLSADIICSS